MTRLDHRYHLLLLALCLVPIFYPVVFGQVNPVDDAALLQAISEAEGTPWTDYFRWNSGSYYRPVLNLTFAWDMNLWGAIPSFMHLENIFLHLANTFMVLLLGIRICRFQSLLSEWVPFACALVFGLHPINTEAVNWISGRSDLLAGFFVLSAAVVLVEAVGKNRAVLSWLSLIPLILAALCKETAVFFVPAAVFLGLYVGQGDETHPPRWRILCRERLRFIAPFLLLPLLYIPCRLLLNQRDGSLHLVKNFLAEPADGWGGVFHGLLSGAGFYAKKLIIPWPLDFTIAAIPPGYLWLGLCLIPQIFFWVWKRETTSGLFLAAASVASSALVVILLRPAWTVAAERYLYIPSAFFCLAFVPLAWSFLSRCLPEKFFVLTLLVFTVVWGGATMHRNLIWMDNLKLIGDAASKSPDFPFVHSVLADLLIQAGRVEEGRQIILTNRAPAGLRNADFLDLQRAKLYYSEGDFLTARQIILGKRRPGQQLYYTFQKLLAKVDAALLGSYRGSEWEQIYDETVAVHEELYRVYKEPLYLYRLGQICLQFHQYEKAALYFSMAYKEAPAGAHYKKAALKLSKQIGPK